MVTPTHRTFQNKGAANREAAHYRKQFGLGLDGRPRRYGKKPKEVAVYLSKKDWLDLRNFVNGDLDNMAMDDPIKIQMKRITDKILLHAVSG